MSTELRFKGRRDIIFPKWLRDRGFIDSSNKETGSAATAIRLLPNKRLLIMRVYPKNVFQRPKGVERFELELSDHEGCGRARLGSSGMPHVMSRMIARAIRDNETVETITAALRPQMRVYNEANGAGTVEQIEKQEGGRFCRVRWDLTQRITTWVSENSCDPDISNPNQSETAA